MITDSMTIRTERPEDNKLIANVIDKAFAGMPYADGDEAALMEKLRIHHALTLSLVAEVNGELIGQVAFSPARTSEYASGWFTLGPLAVLPAYQRQGVGSRLVEQGLAMLMQDNALGCILTGNLAYYRRFGFEPAPANAPEEKYAKHFMIKRLRGTWPKGRLDFHPVFYGAE